MVANLTDQSIIPNRALKLGDVMSGMFRVVRTRVGMVALLGALPSILIMVVTLAAAAMLFAAVWATLAPIFDAAQLGRQIEPPSLGALFGVIALAAIGIVVISVAAWLLQIRFHGMTALLTVETVAGQSPSLGELWDRTKGMIGRILLLVLIVAVAGLALALIIAGWFAWLLVTIFGLASQGGDPETMVAPLVGSMVIFIFLYIGFIVAAVFISVRLYPLLPVIALEELSAVDCVKRAWRLTSGVFWRTLGFYLLLTLLVQAIGYVAQLPGSLLSQAVQSQVYDNIDDPWAVLGIFIPAILLTATLPMLVSIFTTPMAIIYQTIYYIDLVRRRDLGMTDPVPYAPHGPQPGQPSYAQPGQPGYGQQPDPYGRGQSGPSGYGGQGQYGPSGYGEQGGQYGQNATEPNRWDQGQPPSSDQYGQNQYGQNQYGQNQYGQNQYGQNQYGQNQYGQNQYGQNQYGQKPYGQNPSGTDPNAPVMEASGRPSSDHLA